MIIAGIIVTWLALGYCGSLLVLWFGFAGDGLDVRRSDLLGIGVGMACFGPINLLIGIFWMLGHFTKRDSSGGDPVVWRGH